MNNKVFEKIKTGLEEAVKSKPLEAGYGITAQKTMELRFVVREGKYVLQQATIDSNGRIKWHDIEVGVEDE